MSAKSKWFITLLSILAVGIGVLTCFQQAKTDQRAYSSNEYGFSIVLPTAYEENNGVLSFGPYELVGEGVVGEKARLYTLTVIPVRSVDAVVQFVEDDNVYPEFKNSAVVMDVGGVKVVRYRTDGLCDSPLFEIVGKANNYRMQSLCQGNAVDMLKIIETMRVF